MAPSEVTSTADSALTDSPVSPSGYHATFDRIAQIARQAAGADDPLAVSRRKFDKARLELGLADEVPTPQGLEVRYGRSLRDLIQEALRPAADRVAWHGPDQSDRVLRSFSDELMMKTLRACALALDEVPMLGQYDKWAADFKRARQRAGKVDNPLPHSRRFVLRYGSWPKALVAAGLIEEPNDAPAGRARRERPRPVAELVSQCIDEMGVLPSSPYFKEWARRRDITVGVGVRQWSTVLKECRKLRRAAGKSTPRKVTPVPLAPSLDGVVPEDPTRRRRRKSEGYTLEDLIASARHYLDNHVPPGKAPGQKHYRECCHDDPDLIYPSVLQTAKDERGNKIRFQDLMRLAEASR